MPRAVHLCTTANLSNTILPSIKVLIAEGDSQGGMGQLWDFILILQSHGMVFKPRNDTVHGQISISGRYTQVAI